VDNVHASDTSGELVLILDRLGGGASFDVIVPPPQAPVLVGMLSG
jgi:hypothetical protein